MTVRLSLERWSVLCALSLASCIADLRPEVGERLKEQGETESPSSNDDGQDDSSGDAPGDGDGVGDGDGDAPGDDDADDNVDAGISGDGDGEGDGDADGEGGQDAGMDNGCAVKDSDKSRSVSFASDVMPILAVCRCHNPNSDDPFAILESGLTIDGYENLRKGGEKTGVDVIVSGNPCTSIILQKLSETPPFGERMPLMGPYLSQEQRTLISDWIAEGAHDN
jgi:hypothetical protein